MNRFCLVIVCFLVQSKAFLQLRIGSRNHYASGSIIIGAQRTKPQSMRIFSTKNPLVDAHENNKKESILICGGGPAGLLCAIMLAQKYSNVRTVPKFDYVLKYLSSGFLVACGPSNLILPQLFRSLVSN